MTAPIRIGIIGGQSSGKTTFLGALSIAVVREPTGEWRIVGKDDASISFMSENKQYLLNGEFPPTSLDTASCEYTISGYLTADRVKGVYQALGGVPTEVLKSAMSMFKLGRRATFTMNVVDYPGGDLLTLDIEDELWKFLARCNGIIYLFDPLLEKSRFPNYRYIDKAATCIYVHCDRAGTLIQDRLPHFIAVAITKSDEPEIQEAIAPFPNQPEKAFATIADELTVPTIRNFFVQRRTAYYFVSSIGFFQNPVTRTVDPNDRYNVVHTPEGVRLRGRPNPINVFEPLLWIYSNLSREA